MNVLFRCTYAIVYLGASRLRRMCSRRGLEGRDVSVVVAHSAADLIDVYILDARQAHGRNGSKLKKKQSMLL